MSLSASVPESPSQRRFSTNPFWILSLFCILLTVVKIVISIFFASPQVFDDELIYDTIARQVYTGTLLFSSQPYPPGPFPPGCGFFMSIAYLLTPDKYVAYHYMLMINAVLTSSVIFPAYFLLTSVTPRNIALCGAVLTGLMPSVSMNTFLVMSEGVFIPLVVFSIWFVYRSLSDKNPCFWDILTGITLFLLPFTRAAGWSMSIGLIGAVLWMVWSGDLRFDRLFRRKVLLIALPVLSAYLLWAADQILTKGTMPAGYSLSRYAGLFIDVLTHNPGHLGYVILLHLDYLILGSFVFLPLLALFAVLRIRNDTGLFRADLSDSDIPGDPVSRFIPVSIYAGISSFLVFLFGISHMIQFDPAVALCGRYMDPIIPVIVIAGIIGLYIAVRSIGPVMYLKWSIVYLALVTLLTGLVMLPSAHEPNNNPALFYLYSLTTTGLLPLFALICGIVFTFGVFLVIRKGSGIIPLMIVIILFATLSTVPILLWEVKIAAKAGSVIPFCQDVSNLCARSGIAFWDPSTDQNEWDRIVYYTLKFWLGDRVMELKNESLPSGDSMSKWIITKRPGGDPVIVYSEYRVIPYAPGSSSGYPGHSA